MVGHTKTLDPADTLRLLRTSRSARIAFAVGGEPVVVPTTVSVDPHRRIDVSTDDDQTLRHLDGRRVALEVDSHAPNPRTGWYIVVQGVAKAVNDRQFVVTPSTVSGHRLPGRTDDNWFAGVPES